MYGNMLTLNPHISTPLLAQKNQGQSASSYEQIVRKVPALFALNNHIASID
jgi:hypothetical protein